MAAISLLGGKCIRCEWSGHIACYEFHHPDANKECEISRIYNKSWDFVKMKL